MCFSGYLFRDQKQNVRENFDKNIQKKIKIRSIEEVELILRETDRLTDIQPDRQTDG